MTCPNCSSDKVAVQIVQTGGVTRHKGRGCIFGLLRIILIIFTFGLWLVFARSKGKSKTTFQNEKHAVCSGCGHNWVV